MDNFNYKAYLKSGKIYGEQAMLTESEQISEKKYKQGYDDREDESLGARRGAEKDKKQSMKDRRDDSYGKFGKRDAEAKGKAKGPGKNKVNKEGVDLNLEDDINEVGKGYFKKEHGIGKKDIKETILEAKAKINEGSYPFDQCLDDNEGKYGKKGAAKVCGAIRAAYGEGLVKEDKRTDAEQEGYKDGFEDAKDDVENALKKMKVSELKAEIRERIIDTLSEEDIMSDPVMRHGDKGDDPAEKETEAMREPGDDTPSDIKEPYYDVNEQEDVDVDIDVEDEVEVEAGADDIEIERPGVKAKVEVGLSPEEEIVQDSLKAAMDAADALGSQKLADQIGNTITFFTREFVVGNNSD